MAMRMEDQISLTKHAISGKRTTKKPATITVVQKYDQEGKKGKRTIVADGRSHPISTGNLALNGHLTARSIFQLRGRVSESYVRKFGFNPRARQLRQYREKRFAES